MKWLKIGFLVMLILSTVLTSYPQCMLTKRMCIEEKSEINIVDKAYKSRNEYLDINVIVPQVKNLENKDKEEALNNKITKWTEDWINDVVIIADEYFKNQTPPLMSYQLYARYKVTNKGDLISFYTDYYQFTGGAHGITTRIAYTIDKETGEELKLQHLFKEGYEYKEKINNEIYRQIKRDPDRYFLGKEGFNGIDENTKFYIKNNEIVVFYGLYEIAPYASGISEFHLSNKLFDDGLSYDKI